MAQQGGVGQSIHRWSPPWYAPTSSRAHSPRPRPGAPWPPGLRAAGFDDVRVLPLADGGDGTLDALLDARGGSRRQTTVTGPLGDDVDAEWGLLHGGTAVIEMARASGLELVVGRNDALRASTRGTGELIAAALRAGARRVVVGVGGSASTDGGLAAVEALGWSLGGADVTVACDVTTLFADAARVFGPQKGATDAQVSLLTRRLARLADQYEARTGVDVRALARRRRGGRARRRARRDRGAAWSPGSTWWPAPPGWRTRSTTWRSSSPAKGGSTRPASTARWSAACSSGPPTPGVPRIAVIAGQATPEGREEIAVFAGAELLVLTDRVWQSGEAFSRAALLGAGSGYRSGTRRADVD